MVVPNLNLIEARSNRYHEAVRLTSEASRTHNSLMMVAAALIVELEDDNCSGLIRLWQLVETERMRNVTNYDNN